jgi:hypothetical protein
MTMAEGGRHSYDSIQLEWRDNVGLPDLVPPRVEAQPTDPNLVKVEFTWVSEIDEHAPSFKIVQRSEIEGQR